MEEDNWDEYPEHGTHDIHPPPTSNINPPSKRLQEAIIPSTGGAPLGWKATPLTGTGYRIAHRILHIHKNRSMDTESYNIIIRQIMNTQDVYMIGIERFATDTTDAHSGTIMILDLSQQLVLMPEAGNREIWAQDIEPAKRILDKCIKGSKGTEEWDKNGVPDTEDTIPGLTNMECMLYNCHIHVEWAMVKRIRQKHINNNGRWWAEAPHWMDIPKIHRRKIGWIGEQLSFTKQIHYVIRARLTTTGICIWAYRNNACLIMGGAMILLVHNDEGIEANRSTPEWSAIATRIIKEAKGWKQGIGSEQRPKVPDYRSFPLLTKAKQEDSGYSGGRVLCATTETKNKTKPTNKFKTKRNEINTHEREGLDTTILPRIMSKTTSISVPGLEDICRNALHVGKSICASVLTTDGTSPWHSRDPMDKNFGASQETMSDFMKTGLLWAHPMKDNIAIIRTIIEEGTQNARTLTKEKKPYRIAILIPNPLNKLMHQTDPKGKHTKTIATFASNTIEATTYTGMMASEHLLQYDSTLWIIQSIYAPAFSAKEIRKALLTQYPSCSIPPTFKDWDGAHKHRVIRNYETRVPTTTYPTLHWYRKTGKPPPTNNNAEDIQQGLPIRPIPAAETHDPLMGAMGLLPRGLATYLACAGHDRALLGPGTLTKIRDLIIHTLLEAYKDRELHMHQNLFGPQVQRPTMHPRHPHRQRKKAEERKAAKEAPKANATTEAVIAASQEPNNPPQDINNIPLPAAVENTVDRSGDKRIPDTPLDYSELDKPPSSKPPPWPEPMGPQDKEGRFIFSCPLPPKRYRPP